MQPNTSKNKKVCTKQTFKLCLDQRKGISFQLKFIFVLAFAVSCKKNVEIDSPRNSITTEQVFNTNANATAAVIAIYSNLINTGTILKFGSGATTIYSGLSAAELNYSSTNQTVIQLRNNTLSAENVFVSFFWSN